MSLFTPLSGQASLAERAAGEALYRPEAAREARRARLFRETLGERCRRVALGAVWSLKPRRIGSLLPLARLCAMQLLVPDQTLPDLRTMPEAGELVGIATDLSRGTLLRAYTMGLFPHSHFGPPKWLSPRERCVLFFDEFHMSKRLKRLMRQGRYTVTFDRDFEGVIKACAGKRDGSLAPDLDHAAHDGSLCRALRCGACAFLRGVE